MLEKGLERSYYKRVTTLLLSHHKYYSILSGQLQYLPSSVEGQLCWPLQLFKGFFNLLITFITFYLPLSRFSTRRSWRSCVCRQSSHVVVSAVFGCPLLGRLFILSTSSAVWEVWIGRILTQTLVVLTSDTYTVLYSFTRHTYAEHLSICSYRNSYKRQVTVVHMPLLLFDFSPWQSEKVMGRGMSERKRGSSGWVSGMTCVTSPLSVRRRWLSQTSSNRSDCQIVILMTHFVVNVLKLSSLWCVL